MSKPFLIRKFLRDVPIRWKLYIVISTLLILMGITIIFMVELKVTSYFQREHYEDTESIARMVAANAAKPILTNDLMSLHRLITDALRIETELKYIYILAPSQKVIAHTFAKGVPAALLELPAMTGQSEQATHRELSTDEGLIHEAVLPILQGEVGHVYIGMSKENMIRSVAEMKLDLIAITALLCLIGITVSLLFNRLITKPISSLVSATKRIGKGELDFEVAGERNDEIGTLTRAFNEMAQSLQINLVKREQTEKALKESKDLYHALIENIALGITYIDKDFNIVIANSAQAKLFGVDSAEIARKKCYREFAKKDEICRGCPGVTAMREDRAVTKQTERTRDDGTKFTVNTRTFPVKNNSGAILGFTEVVEDITEQLLLHEELQKIEHIESIGHLAAGLAHDFNNLLAAVLGNIELAQLTIPPEEPAFQRLNSAEEACDQARSLANQLLTFSKGGNPQRTTTFIPQLLEDSCHFALSGANVKWVMDAPANIWPAYLDKRQIEQVIQSLLINAKEASTAGSKIFVVAENIEIKGEPSIPLNDGKYIKISIEDEGRGIKKELLPKIFDPYFTTKKMGAIKGVGLGLTICHSIIKKHAGHISVKSLEGSGTNVTIYLPKSATDGNITAYAPPPPKQSSATGNYRILLLEDDRKLAKTTSKMLAHLRHEAEISTTGEEAIASHLQAINEGRPYDLLILDLTIRGGMGGNEALQRIRKNDQEVRAIVSSGYSDDPIVVNFRDHGFAGALVKPFTLANLQSAIQRAFSDGESRPS
ncbi:MAG: ATP-binding protein [Thermodesulfobacteriota bacterium]